VCVCVCARARAQVRRGGMCLRPPLLFTRCAAPVFVGACVWLPRRSVEARSLLVGVRAMEARTRHTRQGLHVAVSTRERAVRRRQPEEEKRRRPQHRYQGDTQRQTKRISHNQPETTSARVPRRLLSLSLLSLSLCARMHTKSPSAIPADLPPTDAAPPPPPPPEPGRGRETSARARWRRRRRCQDAIGLRGGVRPR
jgi:hypothetical protein